VIHNHTKLLLSNVFLHSQPWEKSFVCKYQTTNKDIDTLQSKNYYKMITNNGDGKVKMIGNVTRRHES
jgi:hypothetical protein